MGIGALERSIGRRNDREPGRKRSGGRAECTAKFKIPLTGGHKPTTRLTSPARRRARAGRFTFAGSFLFRHFSSLALGFLSRARTQATSLFHSRFRAVGSPDRSGAMPQVRDNGRKWLAKPRARIERGDGNATTALSIPRFAPRLVYRVTDSWLTPALVRVAIRIVRRSSARSGEGGGGGRSNSFDVTRETRETETSADVSMRENVVENIDATRRARTCSHRRVRRLERRS